MSKKIALIYHFLPHYREAVLRRLLTSGRDIVLYSNRGDPMHTRKTWDIPEGFPFVETHGWYLPGGAFFQLGLLKMTFRRDVDTIIHGGDAHFIMTWVSAAIARLLGKRVFFWTHGYTHRDVGWKRAIRKVFYRLPNALLFYGHMAKKMAIEEGFAADRIHVIYNSLDYEQHKYVRDLLTPKRIYERRAELFANPEIPIVVCIARLIREKRFDLLLEAVALLGASGYPVNVLLVGDGPERASLETMAAQRGVNVRFWGACYDERILGELTTAADATVSPGEVGLTAIQSLAFGTPVITHDQWERQGPEWEAVLPGKTGELFHKNDAVSLSEAIRRQTDPDRDRATISKQCIEVVERYWNPDHQVQCIFRALDGYAPDDQF